MTLEQQLKIYITNLFHLPQEEVWQCETMDEIADNILPDKYVNLGPSVKNYFIPTPIIQIHYTKEISILSFCIITNNS